MKGFQAHLQNWVQGVLEQKDIEKNAEGFWVLIKHCD